jgi:hypothetical protein
MRFHKNCEASRSEGFFAAARRLAALYVFSLLFSVSALAGPLDITDTDKIGDLINKFQQALAALVKQAGSEARVTLNSTFQQTDASIQTLAVAYSDSLDKTLGGVDKQQRKAFEDAQKALLNLDAVVKQPLKDVTDTFVDFNTVVGQITIKKPLISRYTPSNIPPAVANIPQITIAVSGFRMCMGDSVHIPKLTIGNNEIPADECTEGRLSFVVPRSFFSIAVGEKHVGTRNALLKMYYNAAPWYKPWSDIQPVQYGLIFNVLPDTLGTYEYNSTILVPVDVPPKLFRSEPLATYSHEGHSGDVHECYPLDPKAGWKYDFQNAKLQIKKGGNETVGNSITFFDDTKGPYNICIRVTAVITAEEHWSSSSGWLEVNLVRDSQDFGTRDAKISGDLGWGDLKLPLHEKPKSETIAVRLFDELDYSFSATDTTILQYLSIQPDTRNNVVYLRPKKAW